MKKKKILFICSLFSVLILIAFLLPIIFRKEKPIENSTIPTQYPKQLITEFKKASIFPTYESIGNEQFVIVSADDSTSQTTIEVYDIPTKKITSTTKLDYYAEICRSFENGTVLLSNYSQYYLFSPDTCKTDIIQVPVVPGYFNHNMSKYYYINKDILYCMDMASKQSIPVQNEYHLSINALEGIHPTTDLLSVYVCTSDYKQDPTFGILDPKDGHFLSLGNYIQSPPSYHDTYFYNAFFDDKSKSYGFRYGSLNENTILKTILLPELQGQFAPSIHFIENSDYAIAQYLLNGDSDSTIEEYRTELWHFGDTLQKCILSDSISGNALHETSTYLPESDLIVSSFLSDGTHTSILICPKFAKFTDSIQPQESQINSFLDKTLYETYIEEKSWEKCPENLKEFSTQIDTLQNRYHIRILLGEHAQKALQAQGYKTTIMENSSDIKEALNELEIALNRYPDNFFQQFKDEAGNGGMTFLFCEDFVDNNVLGILGKGGHAETINNNYYIAVCSCSSFVFCHEIWHATETLILKKNPDAFSPDEWNVLNPKGYNYDNYDIANDPEPNKWTLDSVGTETVYFTDNYGRTNPQEDRANLMSYTMESLIPKEEFLPNKPLRNKLQVMSDAIRSSFDTTGWDTPIWEKYLK